jgi:hypothetical protein
MTGTKTLQYQETERHTCSLPLAVATQQQALFLPGNTTPPVSPFFPRSLISHEPRGSRGAKSFAQSGSFNRGRIRLAVRREPRLEHVRHSNVTLLPCLVHIVVTAPRVQPIWRDSSAYELPHLTVSPSLILINFMVWWERCCWATILLHKRSYKWSREGTIFWQFEGDVSPVLLVGIQHYILGFKNNRFQRLIVSL